MKFSRRDFIHAGCTIAAASLVERPLARARPRGIIIPPPNPLLSQRNIINIGALSAPNYAFINHVLSGPATFGPVSTNFTTTPSTWMQYIDQNGYPNQSAASGHTWGGGIVFPASSNFSGPYVITWDGDGTWGFTSGTWTEASTTSTAVGNANGTTTLSGFSSVVGIAPGFGVTGTGVPGSTTVQSVNYSTNTVVVNNAVTTGSGITFTFTNGTYTKVSNGKWSNTTGVKPYIVVSHSGITGPAAPVSFNNTATGGTSVSVSSMSWSSGIVTVTTASPHGRPIGQSLSLTFSGATPSSLNVTFFCTVTGASTLTFSLANNPGSITGTITYVGYSTNVAVYRQADEVDFMPTSLGGNGHVFRTPFKQPIVNLRPAAVRFMDWCPVNNPPGNGQVCYRFESRSMPAGFGGIGGPANWVAGPAYGATTNTANVYSLAASTGTAGNSQTTPASMVHGEVVQCLFANAMTRAGSVSISAITKANPGQVTATAHGFNTGDVVQILCGTSSSVSGNPYVGMVELNYVPVTVTFVDANNFTIGIDTTTFTTFTVGTKQTASCCAYVTLQVGSGNDRTAYPIVNVNGNGPIGQASSNLATNSYMALVFDKNIAATRSAGTSLNWSKGAWVYTEPPSVGFPQFNAGVPLEYMATMIVELNKLSSSVIHGWINIPHGALQPVDPNYTAASDWALQAAAVMVNGANGFPGLNQTQASVIIELSNELWNLGEFSQGHYMAWLNFIRDGTATTDSSTMTALRSTLMARNLYANSPYAAHFKVTLGLQGIAGYTSPNTAILTGTGTNYFADAWNTWQGGLTPISQHDACNPATYFDPTTTYANTTAGTGTFTDDSAMYNGTDNSGNGGGNYTGAANQAQAIANFVSNIVNGTGAGQQTIANYCSQASPSSGLIAQLTTNIPAGKYVIQYEGAADWPTGVGSTLGTSHTITANDNLFLEAVLQSSAWATAQAQFFSNCSTLAQSGPGALYTYVTTSTTAPRWAYMWPDTYSGGVEGGAFTASPVWTTLATRNAGLS